MAPEAALDGMKIYFDCGTEDEYGFYTGAKQLHDILDARGIDHEFHLYPVSAWMGLRPAAHRGVAQVPLDSIQR